MQRWTLTDPVAGDTYMMRANPKAMTTPVVPHRTTTSARSIKGVIRAFRAPDAPTTWSFVGRLRSVEEYNALRDWAGRANRIVIQDHLGRKHQVMPQSFEPTPVEKSGVGNEWLFDYTFKALYFKRLP